MKTMGLKYAVLSKFETMEQCANAIGMSKSSFSRALKNPSSKFLSKLAGVGVEIERPQDVIKNSELSDSELLIRELKGIIYEKNALIEEQKSIIEQKDLIIKQYEELNKTIKSKRKK